MFFSIWVLTVMLFSASYGRSYGHATKMEPECEPYSICGYLQRTGNSINIQPLCQCTQNVDCPLEWNVSDRRTVIHANDQYKFCEPVRPLPVCSSRIAAYVTYLEMSLLTEEILVNSGFIDCICPSSHLLIKNDSHFHQMDNGIAIITTSYICKPPPKCDLDSICSAVTQNLIDHTSFVTTHCTCPDGFFCPTSIEQAKERIQLEKGSYYTMSCI